MNEPIAIIGMGCRYPGAPNLEALWQLLVDGRDAIGDYSESRFRDFDQAYADAASGRGGIATHRGGFLKDVDRFDAAFFGISPREANFIDPQQRLLLEVSWDALEDAGQIREKYQGSRTGVFTGLWTTDYENHIFRNSEQPEFYLLTGGGRSTACGRISFAFGFEGPSISVDTACSSSMVAVHLACQSLRQQECDMALAGGVNVILSTDFTRLFTNAGMLSKDGRCKFGDESANGFVRSEGAGMVVLKRLSDAVADGDAIYAVVRGSAVNNDGRSSGLLVTPSRDGQRMMLLEAWRQAGISGADLSYIEAHGTGTQVGDPVEIGAISDALKQCGTTERIPIGSMKGNIGHTESAAGIAGILKTALVLANGIIPPSLHCANPNPKIDWSDSPIEVISEARSLSGNRQKQPLLAGASSFGLTGTNAHMVLAEFRPPLIEKSRDATTENLLSEESRTAYLLPLSGHTATALKANCDKWMKYLDTIEEGEDLRKLCQQAGAQRVHLQHRCAVIGESSKAMQSRLTALLESDAVLSPRTGIAQSASMRVVFVAPGQGSQWDGMARDLLRENAQFRESFEVCDRAIFAETGWSLIDRLNSDDAARYLTEIDFVQPALFAMSVALAAVWRAAGVIPDVVIGHSMGEVAAAHIAGILSLNDASAVICRRSRLMRTLSGSGAMASVELPSSELTAWLEPFAGKISIAAENSPGSTVVAGEADQIDQLLEWLELKEIFSRRIKVDVASHSSMVDPILAALAVELAEIKPSAGSIKLFSTVRSSFLNGKDARADYWIDNLRNPVRLSTAVDRLVSDGYNCFIELSPHPVLVPALENTLQQAFQMDFTGFVLPSLLRGKPAWLSLLDSMGRFWIDGGRLDWKYLSGNSNENVSRRRHFPDYAFERERFWPEESDVTGKASKLTHAARLSPLLESRIDPANEPGTSIFTIVNLQRLPYLIDHRVGGAIVFPASAHLEAALEAAAQLAPATHYSLEAVSFRQALYLSATDEQELQLIVHRVPGKNHEYKFSLEGRQGSREGSWTEHSTGVIRCSELSIDPDAGLLPDTVEVSSRSQAKLWMQSASKVRKGSGEEHYSKARRGGLEYGPAFRLVESFESANLNGIPWAETKIRVDSTLSQAGYLVHPTLLDCCFQAMIHLRPRIAGMPAEDVYLPLSLRSLKVLRSCSDLEQKPTSHLTTKALFTCVDVEAGTMEFELQLISEEGLLMAVAEGMTVQRVKTRSGEGVVENLFTMSWAEVPSPSEPTPGGSAGNHWLIFADSQLTSIDGPTGLWTETSTAAILARSHAALAGRSTLVWVGPSFRALSAEERRLDQLGADEYELPPNDFTALDTLLRLVAAEAVQISAVIDLWTIARSADEESLSHTMGAQQEGTKFLPNLAQAISRAGWNTPPQLWLITNGTQNTYGTVRSHQEFLIELAGSTAWGLGAAIAREMPELRPILVDLSSELVEKSSVVETENLVRLISQVSSPARDLNHSVEDRLSLRGAQVFAARLTPCINPTEQEVKRPLQEGEAFCVETKRPGAIDQLSLRAIEPAVPKANEITISVAFAGLNFIDVAKALGIYPGLDSKASVQMGGECSGVVVAIGEGVEGFRPGDEVVALTASPTKLGLLASQVNLPMSLVVPKPAGLSLVEAAGIPIAYLTAHYALNELARLRGGEWVLIHAGAGGVGLAAASIALQKGARVIATASSVAKHEFLHDWGVEHVLQSRSLDFADGVLRITGGKGVDVVLNSLAGDYISKSLEVLAPYGRFIELGKRDIYDDKKVGLRVFRQNISYFVVDLAAFIEDRPEETSRMFREVVQEVASGRWARLPMQEFSAHEPAEAFDFMARGRHIGKIAIDFRAGQSAVDGLGVEHSFMVLPAESMGTEALFSRHASYLITGGLGGVGLAVAEWMAANGAGCLVLASRREPGPLETQALAAIRESGARIEHRRVDLLDLQATADLVEEIDKTMPPLRGVMHAAAVIDDALISNLSADRFDSVFGPKVGGTWHLHEATLNINLDFFVMFSSFASIFPQPGHGSYSAANSFMDSFASYRRSLGLPAMSINWAGWLGMGLARESGTSRTIEAYDSEGFGSFERDEALSLLGEALRAKPVQAAAVRIDTDVLARSFDATPPLFRSLLDPEKGVSRESSESPSGTARTILSELYLDIGRTERLVRLEALLRTETSRVLKLAPERISSTHPFGQMGIDSLMALELIRRINVALGLSMPATAVFNYPTVSALASQVLKRLGLEDTVDEKLEHLIKGRSDRELKVDVGRAGSSIVSEAQSEEDALKELMESGESPHEA